MMKGEQITRAAHIKGIRGTSRRDIVQRARRGLEAAAGRRWRRPEEAQAEPHLALHSSTTKRKKPAPMTKGTWILPLNWRGFRVG